MKNRKGFTLVELVVVIAIIGILAAILVPSMMGYVRKSRLQTANGNAKTAYNAAKTYIVEQEAKGISEDSLFGSGGKFNAGNVKARPSALNEGDQQVANALIQNGDEAGYFCIFQHTKPAGDKMVVAHWRGALTDKAIGQYPDAVDFDNWEDNYESFAMGAYIQP